MSSPFDETTLEQRTEFNEWLSEHWDKLPIDFNWTRQHDRIAIAFAEHVKKKAVQQAIIAMRNEGYE